MAADPSAADATDDLDQLLDSALDDFTALDLTVTHRSGDAGDGKGEQDQTKGKGPSPAGPSVQGLGLGLPDRKLTRKVKQKGSALPPPQMGNYASEALEKLTQQTREAVRGVESATAAAAAASGAGTTRGEGGLDNDAMVEEFVKQFEELAGSQEMESIVETMMHQLLSKDILYEPMKEIGQKYPKWLEEHKTDLSQKEYDRYHHQYELILQLNEVYESDPNNFQKIADLMQKMQECGQPPNDIVREVAPDIDLSNLGQQSSPELLESTPSCCVM